MVRRRHLPDGFGNNGAGGAAAADNKRSRSFPADDDAAPFPAPDGPVYREYVRLLRRKERGQRVDAATADVDPSLPQATRAGMMLVEARDYAEREDTESPSHLNGDLDGRDDTVVLMRQLLRELMAETSTARSLKQQLRSFQAFRRSWKKKKMGGDGVTAPERQSPEAERSGELEQQTSAAVALLRILLEFCMYPCTPSSARKASQACISDISLTCSLSTNEATSFASVVADAVLGLTAISVDGHAMADDDFADTESDDTASYTAPALPWRSVDPLLCLQELLLHKPALECILAGASSSGCRSSSPWTRIIRYLASCMSKAMTIQVEDDEGGGAASAYDDDDDGAIQRGVLVANLCKLVFHPVRASVKVMSGYNNNNVLTTKNDRDHEGASEYDAEGVRSSLLGLAECFLAMFSCRSVPNDDWLTVSMAYCRILFLPPDIGGDGDVGVAVTARIATECYTQADALVSKVPLAAAALLQALAATVPSSALFSAIRGSSSETHPSQRQEDSLILLYVLFKSFQRTAVAAVDPEVRLAALKGIRSLISRSRSSILDGTIERLNSSGSLKSSINYVADECLPVVMQAWEHPPTKKLGNAISELFKEMVALMELLLCSKGEGQNANRHGDDRAPGFKNLVELVLQQPPNRKGRYLALETLLPITGAQSLLGSARDGQVILDLLAGIGNRSGLNTAAIADLWARLLGQLWVELRTESGLHASVPVNCVAGISTDRKQRRTMKKKGQSTDRDLNESNPLESNAVESAVLRKWLDTWVPGMVSTLLHGRTSELYHRKRAVAFCFPRITTTISIHRASATPYVTEALCLLLHETHRNTTLGLLGAEEVLIDSPFLTDEPLRDRRLWLDLEIAAFAQREGLMLSSCKRLRDCIAKHLPLERLKEALIHSASSIRSVAFQSIESIADASSSSVSHAIQLELELWKYGFPSAIKTDDKDYRSTLLQCLLSFLDRLLFHEASSVKLKDEIRDQQPLPLSSSFIVDFILNDVFVSKAAYPGTVAGKESFALSLLGAILVFATRDISLVANGKLLFPKIGAVIQRRRQVIEELTMGEVRRALLGTDVVSSVFALLHSVWEDTRASAFSMLRSLIHVGYLYCVDLPDLYLDPRWRRETEAKSIYFASSPRQREADTGARILAVLYFSIFSEVGKSGFLSRIVTIIESRINNLRQVFRAMLNGENVPVFGNEVQLAHGIVHGMMLIVEHGTLPPEALRADDGILLKVIELLNRAIQISLSVVADVLDGCTLEGMDLDLDFPVGSNSSGKAKTVNPGWIGANGVFSSVERTDAAENARRIASQRIIVGSWLLMKVCCSTLATVVTMEGFDVDSDVLNETGTLLINTLTALKHAGAAFAAHRALQRIALAFLNSTHSSLQILPSKWLNRLMIDVSETERVRNAILRRSTGYALGFLSLMRAEVSSRSPQKCLCRRYLTKNLQLSLPPKKQLEHLLDVFGCGGKDGRDIFCFLSQQDECACSLAAENNEDRARIHALNILRLAILDSPLTKEVYPLVGDAIVSAIMGYMDPEWHIRNSATMVFAAAMLRVVDADKNASNTDASSNNAITFAELFRAYPTIFSFLRSVMDGVVSGRVKAQGQQSLPPLLPILLLLTRVQPVCSSGSDTQLVEPFIPLVFQCLGHPYLTIRDAAARTLANLAHGEKSSPFSASSLVAASVSNLSKRRNHWNECHGALLASLHLIQSFSEVKNDVSCRSLFELIRRRVTCIVDGRFIAPPLCISTAVEILAALQETEDGSTEEVDIVCQSICACLAKDNSFRDADTIGLSKLGATVGTIACYRLCSGIWSAPVSREELQHRLDVLSDLFTCRFIDVRIYAVKTFKKSIYEGLDDLLALGIKESERSAYIIESLARMLTGAVSAETDRLGPHPPTLRRLSRCLLECLEALRKIGDMAFFDDNRVQELRLSLAFIGDRDTFAISRTTPLIGNGVELMGFALKDGISNTNDAARIFSKSIDKLSDPSLSWRLRLSTALAMYNSRILCVSYDRNEAHLRFFDHAMPWRVIRRLLQDADADVRYAASMTISLRGGKQPTSVPVPDLLLHRSSKWIAEDLGFDGFIGFVSSSILEVTEGLEEKLILSVRGLSLLDSSLGQEPLSGPLPFNTGKRKIFEEENPNSYIEPILNVQSLLVTLVEIRNNGGIVTASACDGNVPPGAVISLLCRCHAVLSLLVKTSNCDDRRALYDATRSHNVMPPLHCLFLGVGILLHRGCSSYGSKKSCEVQLLAQQLLSAVNASEVFSLSTASSDQFDHNENRKTLMIDPMVARALELLCHPSDETVGFREKATRACFLVT